MSLLAEAHSRAAILDRQLLEGGPAKSQVESALREILRLFSARFAAFHGSRHVPDFLRLVSLSHTDVANPLRIPPGAIESVVREGCPWKPRYRGGDGEGFPSCLVVPVADGSLDLGAFCVTGFPARTFEEPEAVEGLCVLLRPAAVAVARALDAQARSDAESAERQAKLRAERAEETARKGVSTVSPATCFPPRPLLGNSPAMQELRGTIAKVAPVDANVLVQGETGTGKELVARAIHYDSPRAEGPFYPVNIKDTSDSLMDSSFRGHSKHAFTGAEIERRGHFELAHGGTLFLDEIAEASMDAQAMLLRPVNERCVQRLGEGHFRPFDVRFISATHRDLEAGIREGTFREDFYYRLRVIRIEVPALRDRREDIRLLTDEFLRVTTRRFRGPEAPVPMMDDAARKVLDRHDWPGNVRELENAIERAVALSNGRIGPSDLGDLSPRADGTTDAAESGTLAEQMDVAEREIIRKRLLTFPGDLPEAARSLGIGESTLRKKRSKHEIQTRPFARY